jgi:hypothetical protein
MLLQAEHVSQIEDQERYKEFRLNITFKIVIQNNDIDDINTAIYVLKMECRIVDCIKLA